MVLSGWTGESANLTTVGVFCLVVGATVVDAWVVGAAVVGGATLRH